MPERTAVAIAEQIISIFDETEKDPPLWRINALAQTLCLRTCGSTGIIANVRACLIDSMKSRKHTGRAAEIRSAAQQLAELVVKYPDLKSPSPRDDGIPF